MAFAKCPQCKSVAHFQTSPFEEDRRRDRFKEDEDGYLVLDLCLICGWGGIKRNTDLGGYFNSELKDDKHEWPSMGRLCPHCNLRLPRFLDLEPETASRARRLFKAKRIYDAIREIVEATGCSLNWAKLWVEHPDGPMLPPVQWPGPPCVYCGEPLRTKLAKQCFECGTDWHDPDNIRKLD
ncbi:MAG TPA: hypothetical protein VFS19_01160 [Planctomycetota bacterium]|nr:hypothetical protein [Planctomycetota bacterium]